MADLTGAWSADDGGMYFVRQAGEEIAWVGMSEPTEFHPGVTFTNVFRGTLDPNSQAISGEWIDLPRGGSLGAGALTLSVLTDSQHLARASESGGFAATFWTRAAHPVLPDITSRFDKTMRNDGGSMHHHLKIYKDYVVAFGTVCLPPDADPVFQDPERQNYTAFICPGTWGWPGLSDPPDGDIGLEVQIDRTDLDAQPGFWTCGWLNDPKQVRSKLDDDTSGDDPNEPNGSCNGDFRNMLHCEAIMFGREASDDCTGAKAATLLPGWLEGGANRLVFNGRPVSVREVPGPASDGNHVLVAMDAGPPMVRNQLIRITGVLALDCHADLSDDVLELARPDCKENDPGKHNVEIHPVYSIELLQDFGALRMPEVGLSGVWHGSDVGTYYVRQWGERVWWLGLSRDQGAEFANVFVGTLRGDVLSGNVMDVPVSEGAPLTVGSLVVSCGGFATETTVLTSEGWPVRSWRKLYDTAAFAGHPVRTPATTGRSAG